MKLSKILPITTVYAHCDIPCGIYSSEPARMAAAAVLRMTEKLSQLSESNLTPEQHNNFIRMVQIKEREAQRCKDEILILWTDYFKPEHLQAFPHLHDTIWQATKQCSLTKRTISVAEARKLVEMTNLIADIYHDTQHEHPKAA